MSVGQATATVSDRCFGERIGHRRINDIAVDAATRRQ